MCCEQEDLDRKLQQRQARETGICPVREELYSQTFDELIRQVGCTTPARTEMHKKLKFIERLALSSIRIGASHLVDHICPVREGLCRKTVEGSTEQMTVQAQHVRKETLTLLVWQTRVRINLYRYDLHACIRIDLFMDLSDMYPYHLVLESGTAVSVSTGIRCVYGQIHGLCHSSIHKQNIHGALF